MQHLKVHVHFAKQYGAPVGSNMTEIGAVEVLNESSGVEERLAMVCIESEGSVETPTVTSRFWNATRLVKWIFWKEVVWVTWELFPVLSSRCKQLPGCSECQGCQVRTSALSRTARARHAFDSDEAGRHRGWCTPAYSRYACSELADTTAMTSQIKQLSEWVHKMKWKDRGYRVCFL